MNDDSYELSPLYVFFLKKPNESSKLDSMFHIDKGKGNNSSGEERTETMTTIRFDVATRGVPDFKVIDINPVEVANALQDYVARGSRITGVSIEDISMAVRTKPTDPKKCTLVDLLALGMKLFDAIVWITAGRPTIPDFVIDNTMTTATIPSLHEIAKAVFYCYFFLLTQARYPSSSMSKDKPKVPNFLSSVMGLDKDQSTYVETICSFNPTQFDAKWVKSIRFEGLGQETLSRFGLGVAGYRLFGPFKMYEIKKDLPENIQRAARFASTIARASPTWDVHPITRRPDILTKRGNLNKNLGNLILQCFTEEQIAEMVTTKALFKKPEFEATCKNFEQWGDVDDISGQDRIFLGI
jgi:hypothetical protein